MSGTIEGGRSVARRLLAYRAAAGAVNRARGVAVAVAAAVAALAAPVAAEPIAIVALGDSLTAGYGLSPELAFPARLEAALAAAGVEAAGRQRRNLGRYIRRRPGPPALVPRRAHGSGHRRARRQRCLRGIDPESTYANLDAILATLEQTAIGALLAGMLAPPNLGREYGQAFEAVYTRLAAEHGVVLYPFFLDGVAARPEYLQRDGQHPNVRGVEVIVARILPFVLEALGGTAGRG